MRTVFLGTSDFAVRVLERLVASPHRPALVVTRPDRPRGRGRRLAPPPVAAAARDLGIDVFQPDRVNDPEAVERIAAAEPDAVCVCAFGALLREALLDRFDPLNVHPSLLPRWRGAAPIERAIMAGDDETGVSIMRITMELDAGPVCLQARERIAPDDTFGTLAPRLAELGGALLVAALDRRPGCRPQSEAGVTYAEKVEPQDRRLDGEAEDAASLERRVRALTPHVGAFVELPGGERLGVRAAVATTGDGPRPGRLGVDGHRLLLGTRGGALELLEVQPAGRRAMAAGDYLRGHALPA